jgi:hypothetical protein
MLKLNLKWQRYKFEARDGLKRGVDALANAVKLL